MRILIIDNGTKYINQLLKVLRGHETTVVPFRSLVMKNIKQFDAAILSGGHSLTVAGHAKQYSNELRLIREGRMPVIGICLGFELIAKAFGTPLMHSEHSEKGNLRITIAESHPVLPRLKTMVVYENHRWVAKNVKAPLMALAWSKDGCEILTHESKPIFGFQFHPEKSGSRNDGAKVLKRCLGYIGTEFLKKKVPRR